MTFAMAEVIKGKVSVVAALIQSLISHKPTRLANTGTHSSLIELTELQSISTLWPVRNYTSWLQRHMPASEQLTQSYHTTVEEPAVEHLTFQCSNNYTVVPHHWRPVSKTYPKGLRVGNHQESLY